MMFRVRSAWSLFLVACGGDEPRAAAALPRCTECDIALDRVGILADSFDPGALPDVMVYASRDSAGRTYTISRNSDAVLVFDAKGGLVRRLGEPGSGPGEYRVIRRVFHGPGDSLFVTDWGIGRVTVYTPDLAVARTQTLTNQPDLMLGDGSYVIAAQIRTKDLLGYPLHRIGADGALLNSFGADTPQYRPDLRYLTIRRAAPARGGGIWAVAPGRYVIERWDPVSGQRTQTIKVQSDWFKEVAGPRPNAASRPPAIIETLWEDSAGIIWVVIRDADLEWRAPADPDAERPLRADDYEQNYDWVLEAVDPASGTVLATKRFREVLWARVGSTVLVSASSVTSAGSTYHVWLPRLTPKGGTK